MLSTRTLCFETHHSAKFQTAAHRLVSTFSACAAAEISIGAMGSVGSATATGTEPASRSTQLRKRAKPASTFVRMSSCRLGAYAPSRRKPVADPGRTTHRTWRRPCIWRHPLPPARLQGLHRARRRSQCPHRGGAGSKMPEGMFQDALGRRSMLVDTALALSPRLRAVNQFESFSKLH